MWRVLRPVKCSICWRQETPATAMTVSPEVALTVGKEALLADLAGDVVVLGFVAEGAGHATAAGAAFGRGTAGGFQDRQGRTDADERFLVAVTVVEHARTDPVFPRDAEVVVGREFRQIFVDHECVIGDGVDLGVVW
jgi:hypothetical protein